MWNTLMLVGALSVAGDNDECRAKVITQGAVVHGANGITTSPGGDLWIASALGNELLRLSPDTGEVIGRVDASAGVAGPDDVALGPDGSIYWTEPLTGEVGKLTPGGVASTLATLPPGTNAIAFDPDGRLFVSTVLRTDTLWELDPDGVEAPRLVTENTLFGLNAFDFGADGFIYGPRWFAGQVARIDPETGASDVLASGFGDPISVRLRADGTPLVLDQRAERIFAIDLATGGIAPLADIGPNADNFTLGADGTLYVTSAQNGTVLAIEPDGDHRVVAAGGLIAPGAVLLRELDGDQDVLFVADMFALRFFAKNGRALGEERFELSNPGTIAPPLTLADDGANIIITNFVFNFVQVWDPAEQAVVESHVGEFFAPMNAIRFDGELVVADIALGSVVGANNGVTYMSGLPTPTGLVEQGGELYVGDWATGTIWRATSGGVPAPPVQVVSGLVTPEGITAYRHDQLLVVEALAGRLTLIDLGSGAAEVIASGLETGLAAAPGLPPSWVAMNQAAVGRNDTIYVAGDRGSKVYQLKCD